MKRVTCKSGITGWQSKLQKIYETKEEFFSYCENYGNHARLGFKTPDDAWDKNPLIQGSVVSSDYCVV